MSGQVERYLTGAAPVMKPNIDTVEKAIKFGKGARLDISPSEYAIAKQNDLSFFYVKIYSPKGSQKSPHTHSFWHLKHYLMKPLGEYFNWKPIE